MIVNWFFPKLHWLCSIPRLYTNVSVGMSFSPIIRLVVPTVFVLYQILGHLAQGEICMPMRIIIVVMHVKWFQFWYNTRCNSIAILAAIGQIGSTKLYCSSEDASEALISPSFFCILEGQVTYWRCAHFAQRSFMKTIFMWSTFPSFEVAHKTFFAGHDFICACRYWIY